MNEINWMQQGWECPKCGAVMSPTTSCCVNCRGKNNTTLQSSLSSQARYDDEFIPSTEDLLQKTIEYERRRMDGDAISPLGGDR